MINFRLNEEPVAVNVPSSTRLLYVLRNHLWMKSAKFGCGLGQCGACMVLIDGRPTPSCDVAVEFAADKSVTTLEGFCTPESLHPLQQAFLDEQAAQCGYCIPGIIISAKALLDTNREPTRADIDAALERNLCRCGSHLRIIRAIERAAQVMREESSP